MVGSAKLQISGSTVLHYRAGWWTDSLRAKFPLVADYWTAIQAREGYQASRPDPAMLTKMAAMNAQINIWKEKHSWFNDFFERANYF